MKDMTIRFLKSISIDNIEDFDVDFDYCIRDRFETSKWKMQISKESPWKYHLLRQFQDALINITYPYDLRFAYKSKITSVDALNLFYDWYQTINRIPCSYGVDTPDDNHIVISLANEFESQEELTNASIELENCRKEFQSFLDFINYEIEVDAIIEESEVVEVVSQRKMNKITKAAQEQAIDAITNDDDDSGDMHYTQIQKEI